MNLTSIPAATWEPIDGHAGAVSAEGIIYGAGKLMAGQRTAPVRVRVAQHPETGRWIVQAAAWGTDGVKPVHGQHGSREEAMADAPRVLAEMIAAVEQATSEPHFPLDVPKPPSKATRISWRGV